MVDADIRGRGHPGSTEGKVGDDGDRWRRDCTSATATARSSGTMGLARRRADETVRSLATVTNLGSMLKQARKEILGVSFEIANRVVYIETFTDEYI